MEICIPSICDPTMAPPGKHMMSIFVQYCSYDMDQYGDRDQQREAFGNAVIDTVEEFLREYPSLSLDIRRKVLQPLDGLRRAVVIKERWK